MTQTLKNLNPDNVNLTSNMLEIYYNVELSSRNQAFYVSLMYHKFFLWGVLKSHLHKRTDKMRMEYTFERVLNNLKLSVFV